MDLWCQESGQWSWGLETEVAVPRLGHCEEACECGQHSDLGAPSFSRVMWWNH